MRLRLISTFIIVVISLVKLYPQANQKGNTNVHAYVGTDWYKLLNKTQFNDTTKEYLINEDGDEVLVEKRFSIEKNTSTGCWGLRVEHFLTRKISIGLDFWYAHTSLVAKCKRYDYDQNTPGYTFNSAIISTDLSRLNSTLRFDLHFGRSPFFDPYIHMALGGAVYKYISTSSNSKVHEESPIYLPLSFKVGSGAKFWLNNQFAGFVEVSIGGPLLAAGVCYKIPQKVKLDLKENSY